MLSGLAAPVLAAAPHAGRWPSLTAAAGGALAPVWWFGPYGVPDVASAGAAVAVAAAVPLWRPQTPSWVSAWAAGAASGTSMSMLHAAGASWPAAAPIATIPLIVAWVLAARRPRFAPALLREEALLLLCGLGLGAATLPTVVRGWRSAVALNVHDSGAAGLALPAWTLIVVSASVLLGGGYSAWRRG